MSGKQPAKKKAPPKKGTTVAEHTTATAQLAGPKPRPPPVYNVFEDGQHVPIRPEEFMSDTRADGQELRFPYDDFMTARRVQRTNLHGDAEDNFDADSFRPTAAYLKKLRERDIRLDTEEDPIIAEERRHLNTNQTDEELAQLASDVRQPRFRALLARNTTRLHTADAADYTVPAKPAAVRMPVIGDPDAFARNAKFDGGVRNATKPAAQPEEQAAAIEDDDIMLERRKPAAATTSDQPEAAKKDNSSVVLDDHSARNFLDPNPLAMLQVSVRADLMQLPDVANVYSLLYPLMLQHESQRHHYNVLEFVRELVLCGCKYDGCLQMESPRRLGQLLDKQFYSPFLNKAGNLTPATHEHFETIDNEVEGRRERTRIAIFKFYLVQRTPGNSALLQVVDDNTRKEKEKQRHASRPVTADDEDMRLNRVGIYDIDIAEADKDHTELSRYSAMHHVKNLSNEFMLALRVVCVECEEKEADDREDCASVEDEDFFDPGDPFAVPAAVVPEAVAGAGAVLLDDSEEEDSEVFEGSKTVVAQNKRARPDASMSFSNMAAASMSTFRTAALAPLMDIDEEESDDLDDDEETKMAREGGAALPDDHILLTMEESARFVGKYKQDQFLQRVNGKTFGLLCPRAFMFYAVNRSSAAEAK